MRAAAGQCARAHMPFLVDLPGISNFAPWSVPIRLFQERVIGNWRKSIRMSIRFSRDPAKLTKSHQAMCQRRSQNKVGAGCADDDRAFHPARSLHLHRTQSGFHCLSDAGVDRRAAVGHPSGYRSDSLAIPQSRQTRIKRCGAVARQLGKHHNKQGNVPRENQRSNKMVSKPFVAATSALALLAMTGAVYAGPSSSSLSPGPNYYATIHQGAQPDRCVWSDCAARAQSQHSVIWTRRPSRRR